MSGQEKYCTDDIKAKMGAAIRATRKAYGVSVTELAAECRCCRITIHNIESGKYAAGYTLLYKIGAALNTSPKEFMP